MVQGHGNGAGPSRPKAWSSTTAADPHVSERRFDGAGRPWIVSEGTDLTGADADRTVSITEYDLAGNLGCSGTTDDDLDDLETCPGGERYHYDTFSRLARTRDSAPAQRFEYDGLDRRLHPDGSGCAANSTRDYGYVGLGEQLSLARDSSTKTQTYDYDADLGRATASCPMCLAAAPSRRQRPATPPDRAVVARPSLHGSRLLPRCKSGAKVFTGCLLSRTRKPRQGAFSVVLRRGQHTLIRAGGRQLGSDGRTPMHPSIPRDR